MKKLIGMAFVTLFMMSTTSNAEVKKNDPICEDVATTLFNALEDEYGCYDDAEEANEVYQELYNWCVNA